MKTALKVAGLSAVSALAGLASAAHAQNGATAIASATGSATIIQSLTITKTADLGFGTVVRPTTGTSTITVGNTGNSRSISGGNAIGANNNNVTSAAFLIQGEGGAAISVSAPSFNMTSGSNSLTVTTTNNATANLTGSLGSPGTMTVGVGGWFPLTAATPTGNYSGSLVVTANYN
jgi:hypothetical protein